MIDIKRKFIILNGKVVYFNKVSNFAVQKGLNLVDETEISKLQPGVLTIFLDKEDSPWGPGVRFQRESIGAYLLNYALIFKEPEILIRDGPELYVRIESSAVDILIEHSHKYPPKSLLKPLINLISDEETKF